MLCKHCSKPLSKKHIVFCDSACAAKYNNARRLPRSAESRQKTSVVMKLLAASESIATREARRKSGALGAQLRIIRDYSTKPVSEETKRKLSVANTGKVRSAETKAKMSAIAIQRGLGGHTSKIRLAYATMGGGVVHLHSSYEIALATILDSLGFSWERPAPLPWVDSRGVSHRYYPDFKVGSLYLDTKNPYLAVKDADKLSRVREQNSVDLRMVLKEHLTPEYIGSLVQR